MFPFKITIVENNFEKYFNDLILFCKKAENETKIEKTKRNMKATDWEKQPESLLYRLYKSKKYDNGKGLFVLIYNDDNEIISFSGIEIHNKEIAIMAKRYYVQRKYRNQYSFLTNMLPYQIEWAKKKGMKVCLITINEYNKRVMVRGLSQIQMDKGYSLSRKKYKHGDVYKDLTLLPIPIFINGENQYILVYKIDKDYILDYTKL